MLLPVVDLRILKLFHELYSFRVVHAAVRNVSRSACLIAYVNCLLSGSNFLSPPLHASHFVVDGYVYEQRRLPVHNLYLNPSVFLRHRVELEALRAEGCKSCTPRPELRAGHGQRALERGDYPELRATVRDHERVLHHAGPEREHPDWSGQLCFCVTARTSFPPR